MIGRLGFLEGEAPFFPLVFSFNLSTSTISRYNIYAAADASGSDRSTKVGDVGLAAVSPLNC